jgi:hypothetical protein
MKHMESFFFFFFDMSAKDGEGIRTNDIHFIRRDSNRLSCLLERYIKSLEYKNLINNFAIQKERRMILK